MKRYGHLFLNHCLVAQAVHHNADNTDMGRDLRKGLGHNNHMENLCPLGHGERMHNLSTNVWVSLSTLLIVLPVPEPWIKVVVALLMVLVAAFVL